jgi:hypothetical protein
MSSISNMKLKFLKGSKLQTQNLTTVPRGHTADSQGAGRDGGAQLEHDPVIEMVYRGTNTVEMPDTGHMDDGAEDRRQRRRQTEIWDWTLGVRTSYPRTWMGRENSGGLGDGSILEIELGQTAGSAQTSPLSSPQERPPSLGSVLSPPPTWRKRLGSESSQVGLWDRPEPMRGDMFP